MKNKYYKVFISGIGIFIASTSIFAQSVVQINKAQKFQTIDGFGGFTSLSPQEYNSQFIDKIVNELGATILRSTIPTDMEIKNDNNDPFNTNMAGFNLSMSDGTAQEVGPLKNLTPMLKDSKLKADASKEPMKIIASSWSPPGWMKYVNATFGTDVTWNRLITWEWDQLYPENDPKVRPVRDYKEEYAEYIVAYLKFFKQETGFELYAISLQNEPAFAQSYMSCVYSPEALAGLIRVTGRRIKAAGLSTKIFWAEDIGDLGRFTQYTNAVRTDTGGADKYADIAACHAYNTTGTLAGSTSSATWDGMYRVSNRSKPRPFWMTETSGYGLGYGGAFELAKAMYVALKFGKVSAWVWWSISENKSEETEYGLMTNQTIQPKRYYASKNFYRYVRPEAVSVGAVCSTDVDVLPLAFQHDANKTLTVVLINQSKSDKTITLDLKDPSVSPKKYARYRTSLSENCVKIDSLSSTATITLPKESITTLIGNGSLPATPTGNEDNGTASESNGKLQIYPNPTQTGFFIQGYKAGQNILKIKLLNQQGSEMVNIDYPNDGTEMYVNTEKLANGIYILEYNNQHQKIVINK